MTHWSSGDRAHGQRWGLSLGKDTEQNQQREQACGGGIWREPRATFQELFAHGATRDAWVPHTRGSDSPWSDPPERRMSQGAGRVDTV